MKHIEEYTAWCFIKNVVPLKDRGKLKEIFDCIPAADVKPVVRGRNIINGHPVDGFICSECGFGCDGWKRVVYDEEADDLHCCEYEFKFCPNCGAEIMEE